jgi:hypothetical protein
MKRVAAVVIIMECVWAIWGGGVIRCKTTALPLVNLVVILLLGAEQLRFYR